MEEKTARQKASEKYRQTHKEYYKEYYKNYYKNHSKKNYAKIYKDRLDKIINDLNNTLAHNYQFEDKYGNTLTNMDIDHIQHLLKIARGELDE